MNINRRSILFATAAVAVTTSQSALGHKQGKRVSQQELDEAIQLHGMWLADMNTGQRCTFAGRDLSGLQFGILGGAPIDLNGADFAQADLSGTEADDILVHHCSLNGARFDGCHWRQPVFALADLRRASAKQVKWGMPGRRGSARRSPADFSHAVLRDNRSANMRLFLRHQNGRCNSRASGSVFQRFFGTEVPRCEFFHGTIKRRKIASLPDIVS